MTAAPGRAQNVLLTPGNTVALDGPLTVTGSGFYPNSPIAVFWDQPNPQFTALSNVFLSPYPNADANGNFTFTFNKLVLSVYPATAGPHTLTLVWNDPNSPTFQGSGTVNLNVTDRTGWGAPTPLPTQPTNGLAAGTLAFLRYAPDGLSTSLVVSNGQQERVLGTAAVTALEFTQPDWSPDGTRIAFSTVLDTYPHFNAYVLDLATGAFSQATDRGGVPPRLTGGGAGSITGAILPYVQNLPKSVPDAGEDHCLGIVKAIPPNPQNPNQIPLVLDPEWPTGGYVTLVGTGFTRTATIPPGAAKGINTPMPFGIANVPEGDYSLHMYHNMTVCQETSRTTLVEPNGGGGDGRVIHIWTRAAAIPSITVPVHVTAGQNVDVGAVRVLGGKTDVTSPTWLTNDTLVYDLSSHVFETGQTSIEEIYTATAGQVPVQRSEWVTHGQLSHPDASPGDGLIAGVSDKTRGLFYANPANLLQTAEPISSWQAVLSAFGSTVSVSDHWPAWDPNGSHVAFIRLQPQKNLLIGDLVIQEVATGKETILTAFNVAQGAGALNRPAWSPDRSQIAFTYTTDNLKTTNVAFINVADRQAFLLTSDGRSAAPSWAPARPLEGLPADLAFKPTLPGSAIGNGKPGDLNADADVTVADAVLGLRVIVGLDTPAPDLLQIGDLDADGQFTVGDVTKILQIIVGI